ncbi:MAG: hypothetical protein ACR652_13660 [Methylocystis sp.]|uniref:hypothetical protein n=1 Tax=Methylocystis sp. TaxID=1911079 RepID=UPI003DA3AEDD
MTMIDSGLTPVVPAVTTPTPAATDPPATSPTPTIIPTSTHAIVLDSFASLGMRAPNSSEDSAAYLALLAFEVDSALTKSRLLKMQGLGARLASLAHELEILSAEVSDLVAGSSGAEANLARLQPEITSAQGDVTAADNAVLDAYSYYLDKWWNGSGEEIAKARARYDAAQASSQSANNKLSALQAEADAQQAIIDGNRKTLSGLNLAISVWAAAASDLTKQFDNLSEGGNADNGYVNDLIEEINSLTTDVQAKAKSLQETIDRNRRDKAQAAEHDIPAADAAPPAIVSLAFLAVVSQIQDILHALQDLVENLPVKTSSLEEDGVVTLRD